jgi:hypothetical protein
MNKNVHIKFEGEDFADNPSHGVRKVQRDKVVDPKLS